MRYTTNKFIAFLICLSLLLNNFNCKAQNTNSSSTSVSGDATDIPPVVYGVIGGGLVVLAVAVTIKNHSSYSFRKFKYEISKIDNLLKNKKSDIMSLKNINSEFVNANNSYSNALNSGRKIQKRLSEKKQYFDNQKATFNKYLEESSSSQYKILKNQFFDNIVNNNTSYAQGILDNKINPLIKDWNNLDGSFGKKYSNESAVLNNIILTANTISRTRTNIFSLLNSYNNY